MGFEQMQCVDHLLGRLNNQVVLECIQKTVKWSVLSCKECKVSNQFVGQDIIPHSMPNKTRKNQKDVLTCVPLLQIFIQIHGIDALRIGL